MNINTAQTNILDHKNQQISKPSQHHLSNNINIDLSTSNPQSQYSVSQHGLGSDNTLTNLLMYESQYIPMNKKQQKKSKEGGNRIQENSDQEQPTYYQDNTQGNKYQPSEQESEDLLYNFILKLMGALSYKVRIVQRNVFEEIYIFASRRVFQQHPIAMDLSDSQSEEAEHKGSVMTFNQNKNNNQQEQIPSTMFNFNTNVKRKYTSSQLSSMATSKAISNFLLGKAHKIPIKLDEQIIKFVPCKEQVSQPVKAIRKIIPDPFKEESVDQLGFFDNFDPIYFENSGSDTPPSNDYEVIDYLNVGNVINSRSTGKQQQVKNSFQNNQNKQQEKKNHIQYFNPKYKPVQKSQQIFHVNRQNYPSPTNRPNSFYCKAESPNPQRPISNIQSPSHNKGVQRIQSPTKQIFNDYGRPIKQAHFSKPTTPLPIITNKSPQPFQKINITYNNKNVPILPRSQSQFTRNSSEPNLNIQRNQKVNVVHSPVKPQSSANNPNFVLSNYYVTKNNPIIAKNNYNHKNLTNGNVSTNINSSQNTNNRQVNNHINIQNTSMKRMNTAPSSLFQVKIINDSSQRTLNQTNKTSHDSSSKNLQNSQEKKTSQILPITPTKPLLSQTTKNEEYVNQYYEFTRPKREPSQKQPDLSNTSGRLSTKSKKVKKINVVSSKK